MRSSSVSPYDLQDWAKRAGFELTEETLPPLAGYLGLLIQWNRVMNLVGTRAAEDTFFYAGRRQPASRAFLREDVEYSAAPCCWDLGSGAGLPGLPLRMIWQEGDYWMVEAREKRALFLSTVLAQYPLPGNPCLPGPRRSVYGRTARTDSGSHRQPAFMPWPGVLELVKGNLNPNGVVVLLLRERLQESPDWEQAAQNWRIAGQYTYTASRTRRYLYALTAQDAL